MNQAPGSVNLKDSPPFSYRPGFMMQGETLKAELADCGDITALPGLTEMLTTYVILSRVRKADCLLLMRAFSPYLFKLGNPTGPYCLLKLLRRRFSGAAQTSDSQSRDDDVYGPEEAKAEYVTLTKEWEDKKKLQRTQGMEWHCWSCGTCLPLAGYFDTKTCTQNNDLQKQCITQGFWRRCLACKDMPHESYTGTPIDSDSINHRRCQGYCGLLQDLTHFTEDAQKCNSCKLWETLHMGRCTECNTCKKYGEMGRIDFATETGVRFVCVPELQLVICTVRRRERPKT